MLNSPNLTKFRYDDRWEYLFRVTGKDIYEANENYRDFVVDLPKFPSPEAQADNIYRLFYRNYIKWGEECEDKESTKMKKLAENLNPINTLANAQLFFMVI